MRTVFLTSSPCMPKSPSFNPANGFVRLLKRAAKKCRHGLFVCSDPFDEEFNDFCAGEMLHSCEEIGLTFDSFEVLDARTADDAEQLVGEADFIILCGGHVPTQNAFFEDICLRGLLWGFEGVIIGISAGSMNSADCVYAMPEEEGEASNPMYRRFLSGLGLTGKSILPHYQKTRYGELDGMRLFEDIAWPDSRDKTFYAIPDGSFLYIRDGREEFHGEVTVIRDGRENARYF